MPCASRAGCGGGRARGHGSVAAHAGLQPPLRVPDAVVLRAACLSALGPQATHDLQACRDLGLTPEEVPPPPPPPQMGCTRGGAP